MVLDWRWLWRHQRFGVVPEPRPGPKAGVGATAVVVVTAPKLRALVELVLLLLWPKAVGVLKDEPNVRAEAVVLAMEPNGVADVPKPGPDAEMGEKKNTSLGAQCLIHR